MAARRPPSLREQLRLERAKLREQRRASGQLGPLIQAAMAAAVPAPEARMSHEPGPVEIMEGGPARFVQIIAAGRGYTTVLHALDASGQVWELETVLGDKVAGKNREVLDQFWKKVEMRRVER